MPGISYDESGSLASYFGITFLALLLFPFTYITLRPSKKDALQPLCPCSECQSASTRSKTLQKGGRWRSFTRQHLPLLVGWCLFAYLCYTISQAPRLSTGTVYNPFEILGLSDSSSEKQIKKHYKKLSLQFHPDKIQLAENQTQEDADGKYIELTKAYKSLTDEVTRENLAKYGNPDGPQQREDKIAIPRWVVDGKNGNWVLAAYGLVLGGGIPFVVGRWWFSQRRLTRDNILNSTAELFFHQLREDTDFLSLVTLLASALEFQAILGGKKRGSKKQRKERQAGIDALEKELEQQREEWGVEESVLMRKDSRITVGSTVAKRARALLWTHLLRVTLQDKELESEQLAVLRASPPLLTAMVNISLAHNWLATSLLCIKLQPCLVQAQPASASPLLQFTKVTINEAEKLEIADGAQGKKWCEKYLKTSEAKGEAKRIAERWPRLEIVDAEFKVAGEKLVTPSSIVQLFIKCRYVYPTTSTTSTAKPASDVKLALPNGDHHENGNATKTDSVTEVEDAVTKVDSETDDEKVDIKEKVVDLQKTIVKGVGRKGKVEPQPPKTYPSNGYAHALRWPGLRKPHYYVLLGDSKLDKIIVQPTRITDIPSPRKDGLPSEPREFSLQFQAPPQANLYSFVIHAASDTFLGSDVERPIMMKVEDPPEDAQVSEDEDISDPEEDTLAGQMAMMRGGKVKASGVHGDGAGDGAGGSESSEGEYESSSDEEGPRRGRAINEDSDSGSD